MISALKHWDLELFFAINGHYSDVFDFIMLWVSDRFIWIPFYLFLLALLIREYKIKTLAWILTIALIIVYSDQLSVHLFKNTFQRLRPCHNPEIMQMVHLVKGKCGGSFGFISSHASNAASLMVFVIISLSQKHKWLKWLMPVWVILICYSRIYLGVHYPSDVIVGAIFGVTISFLSLIIALKFFPKFYFRTNSGS